MSDTHTNKRAPAGAGGAAQDGGTPEKALPRGGKAQDAVIIPSGTAALRIDEGWSNSREPIIYKARSEGITHLTVGDGDTCLVPNKFPEWSEARLRQMAAAEDEALSATGGLLAVSPELYAEMEALHGTGRSEKAAQAVENGSGHAQGSGEFFGTRKSSDGIQNYSLGDGVFARRNDSDIQPAPARDVDMAALRDICAGKMPLVGKDVVGCVLGINLIEDESATEVDLCGFKSFNEIDGEWYMCCKEKHPYPKVKHGDWQKI